ncbi:hypothetical protein DY037_07085 [Apilactobacillus micheneri]|uniref:hypothetical protein n=1 Tax=Apilactobacillus micheneri TaxID=1899430 RepID=UPI00112ED6CF|nr:hypothetical protein [Apilactobacillus micheneri]TPR48149.1 hypothetical protein DY037_07085 [Apilactobacillus micheneri]
MELNIKELCTKLSELLGYDVTYLTDMTDYREYAEVGISLVPEKYNYGAKTLAKDVLLRIDQSPSVFSVQSLGTEVSEKLADYLEDNDISLSDVYDDEQLLYDMNYLG